MNSFSEILEFPNLDCGILRKAIRSADHHHNKKQIFDRGSGEAIQLAVRRRAAPHIVHLLQALPSGARQAAGDECERPQGADH